MKALLAAIVACFVLMAAPVQAHIWYSGQDPKTLISCCGGQDCGPIDDATVRIVEGGYVYIPTGEFFEHDRAKPSQDGSYHRCQFLTDFPDHPKGSTRCFFAPPMSF